MQIVLIGKNVLYKLSLPKNVEGNYWLTDNKEKNEKKLINVEGKMENGSLYQMIKQKSLILDLLISKTRAMT